MLPNSEMNKKLHYRICIQTLTETTSYPSYCYILSHWTFI